MTNELPLYSMHDMMHNIPRCRDCCSSSRQKAVQTDVEATFSHEFILIFRNWVFGYSQKARLVYHTYISYAHPRFPSCPFYRGFGFFVRQTAKEMRKTLVLLKRSKEDTNSETLFYRSSFNHQIRPRFYVYSNLMFLGQRDRTFLQELLYKTDKFLICVVSVRCLFVIQLIF